MESPLECIYIYGDDSLGIDLESLVYYLRDVFQFFRVEKRKDFFVYHTGGSVMQDKSGPSTLAERLASIRVLNPIKEGLNPDPIYGEIDYERRKLKEPSFGSIGVIYDGFRLQAIMYPLIKREEKGSGHLHIVITNQLIVTWDDYDRRYHLRVGVFGQPSIISTSGVVEAPAKPREFYLLKQMMGMGDMDLTELKMRFNGRFIDYGDSRITDVIKGYLAQAIFYAVTGNPFCDERGCRLFNAHWQEEMIYAQLGSLYEFCEKHKEIIQQLRNVEKNLSLSF